MTKRIKVITKYKGNFQPQFELRQTSNDLSVYLKVYRGEAPTEESMEYVPSNGSLRMAINLGQLKTVGRIDHSSAHESGKTWTVLKQRSRRVAVPDGVPLTNLRTAKFLWTLVLRDMSLSRVIETQTENDYVIEQPDDLNNLIIDIFAVPEGTINFSTEMYMEKGATVNFGMHLARFNGFNIFMSARGTDQFEEAPRQTVKISGQDDWVPSITHIGRDRLEFEARHVQFRQIDSTSTEVLS